MNSQRKTDSSDDSNAVTVHISKHSQVPDRERGRGEGGTEGGRGVKKCPGRFHLPLKVKNTN